MAAAGRPYWTGFLKLSLVTIGVRLYSAVTEQDRIHFHQIHEPSGERVRYQTVVPGLGPVERSDIVKGYEYQKGRYVTVEPSDLESSLGSGQRIRSISPSLSIATLSTRFISTSLTTSSPTAPWPKRVIA